MMVAAPPTCQPQHDEKTETVMETAVRAKLVADPNLARPRTLKSPCLSLLRVLDTIRDKSDALRGVALDSAGPTRRYPARKSGLLATTGGKGT